MPSANITQMIFSFCRMQKDAILLVIDCRADKQIEADWQNIWFAYESLCIAQVLQICAHTKGTKHEQLEIA